MQLKLRRLKSDRIKRIKYFLKFLPFMKQERHGYEIYLTKILKYANTRKNKML